MASPPKPRPSQPAAPRASAQIDAKLAELSAKAWQRLAEKHDPAGIAKEGRIVATKAERNEAYWPPELDEATGSVNGEFPKDGRASTPKPRLKPKGLPGRPRKDGKPRSNEGRAVSASYLQGESIRGDEALSPVPDSGHKAGMTGDGMDGEGERGEAISHPAQSPKRRPFGVRGRNGLLIEHKRHLVICFAQFFSSKAAQASLLETYGREADRRTIENYNADGGSWRGGAKLLELFHVCREQYLKDVSKIGVANQAYRLRLLERLIDKAETAKEYDVAMRGLKQAAEEMGGTLTNVAKVRHEGSVEHRHLSADDARAELAMRLSAVIEGHAILSPPPPALPAPDDGQGAKVPPLQD